MTMLLLSISNLASSCTSRSVSYSDRNSGMQTQMKVVRLGSLNWMLTSSITDCSRSEQSLGVRQLHLGPGSTFRVHMTAAGRQTPMVGCCPGPTAARCANNCLLAGCLQG